MERISIDRPTIFYRLTTYCFRPPLSPTLYYTRNERAGCKSVHPIPTCDQHVLSPPVSQHITSVTLHAVQCVGGPNTYGDRVLSFGEFRRYPEPTHHLSSSAVLSVKCHLLLNRLGQTYRDRRASRRSHLSLRAGIFQSIPYTCAHHIRS